MKSQTLSLVKMAKNNPRVPSCILRKFNYKINQTALSRCSMSAYNLSLYIQHRRRMNASLHETPISVFGSVCVCVCQSKKVLATEECILVILEVCIGPDCIISMPAQD